MTSIATSVSVEQRAWHLLQQRAWILGEQLLFGAATGGRLSSFGMLLPIEVDGQEYVASFTWHNPRQSADIVVFGHQSIEEPLQKAWWLRQAIRLLKVAASKVERWTNLNERMNQPSWRELVCKLCGSNLGQHIQPGLICPHRAIGFV